MLEITIEDIQNYLATKRDDEIIGYCMNSISCLAHNTLVWKYGLEQDEVDALCTFAYVTGSGRVDFPKDVVRAVRAFDTLKENNTPVTKAEFLEAMNEW